ncbi:hypothetical protein BP6252_01776 [Coleophoma cylindrospora]|uniref:Major facilitator superfamily (MFS) profile domain-containing protein n=1 Tax=Coleophoma cylindrospora TaxID=1849047 RepID=A0A3D8SU12_9HELO|nr:hypothetical protein BP6252_01776 [Coleophoma cylindrospora]
MAPSPIVNWGEIQPHLKWHILSRQKRFSLWVLYTSVGSLMLGYDYGVSGTCTVLPEFQEQYGVPFPSQPSGFLIPASYQAGWAGSACAGLTLGTILAGYTLDSIGRKHTVAVGGFLATLGIVMQVVSRDWDLFLIGRLVNAIGFGTVFLQSPVWIGENARPELRGFFLCVINCSIVLGQFILSIVANVGSAIEGKWSYMTVLLFQFVFIARESLCRIHGSSDEALINAEMNRIAESVRVSNAVQESVASKGSLLRQCFQDSNKKRTLIAILAVAGQQFIGAAFVLGYVTYFLSLIGVKQYFTVSVVLYVVMFLSNLFAFVAIETCGRRKLLLPGIFILTGVLLIMGIMGCLHTPAATWVVIVCIFIWAIAYESTIGAVGFALGSEVAPLPLRAKVQGLVGIIQGVFGWVVGFISPYMINPDAGNLGAKVGFVFAGLGVPICIAFWIWIPETKGLNFEEIDYLFGANVDCRKFPEAIEARRAATGAVNEGAAFPLKETDRAQTDINVA